jgi:hypothetical protein
MEYDAHKMDTDAAADVLPKQLQQLYGPRHPREVTNRPPTPQDLLELSSRFVTCQVSCHFLLHVIAHHVLDSSCCSATLRP